MKETFYLLKRKGVIYQVIGYLGSSCDLDQEAT